MAQPPIEYCMTVPYNGHIRTKVSENDGCVPRPMFFDNFCIFVGGRCNRHIRTKVSENDGCVPRPMFF